MAKDFGFSKRRIQEAKKKKREEKRLKRLNKDAPPAIVDADANTDPTSSQGDGLA